MINVLSRNRVTSAERKKLGKFIILFEKTIFFAHLFMRPCSPQGS